MRALLIAIVLILTPGVIAGGLPSLFVLVTDTHPWTNAYGGHVVACSAGPGTLAIVARWHIGGTDVVPTEDPPYATLLGTTPTGEDACPHLAQADWDGGGIWEINLEQCYNITATFVTGTDALIGYHRRCS